MVEPVALHAQAVELLDHLLEGCQLIGFDYEYVYLNPVAANHGKSVPEQLVGRKMSDCFPGIETTEMYEVLTRCMEQREPASMFNEFVHVDGSVEWFELRFQPVPRGVFVLSINVTRRHMLEEQARASQRLEAVGRLAAGIAHDFNNLLTVIQMYASMSMDDVTDPHVVDSLKEIFSAGQRAAALTQQLLAFSRRRVAEPIVVSPNEIITSLEPLLTRLLGDHIEMRISLDPDIGAARIDPTQLEQVVMNLVLNARDAMPSGGKLTVETTMVELDEDAAATRDGASAGPHVVIAVTDSGSGMDAKTRDRIFDPFFTTKAEGKGSGIGLATVDGIVKQSGGYIWLYSEPGAGTCFKVYLPVVERAAIPSSVRSPGPARVGNEAVLVAEDQDAVRAAIERILQRAGYEVLLASSGEEALRRAADYRGELRLLLTDVVMTQMSGRELAEAIRERHPEAAVLFTSGYPDSAIVHHGGLDNTTHFISKPFTVNDLLRSVRSAIDAHPRLAES